MSGLRDTRPLLAVETADIVAGQLFEFAPSEFGDDVMINVAPLAVVCSAANGTFHAIGEPHISQILLNCKIGG